VPRTSRRAGQTRITLSEEDGVRYLHFGTEWIQGGMRIARPWQLVLEYQKQMMAIALLLPGPRRILQLGLGAAALTKFCGDDDRLSLVNREARDYLGSLAPTGRTDWLQVDLYDAEARGPVHDDVDFYRLCRRALRRPGVACFNLFGARFDPSFGAISEAFEDRVLAGPVVDEGNRIVFAVTGPRLDLSLQALAKRAAALESAWRLPFRRWLVQMIELNALPARLRL
jgi:spermidine synthase